jgi:enoyl-CoA hydratase
MDDNGAAVEVEPTRPGVVTIRLNRPDRLNAIDDALIAGLHDAIDTVEAHRSCRTVILTGAGRGFCAGFDMKGGDYEGDPSSRPLADLLAGQKRLSRIVLRLHELPKAVIAAVNGPAVGGGFSLAVAADIRVAAASAVFLAANVRIGVSGGEMGLSWRLPRLVGLARATELLLTGRRVGADEALAIGLVTRVVADDELLDTALAVAEQVAGTSSFGTWMTKELLDASEGAGSFRHALQLEDRTQVLCNFTGDVAEAVTAFREGRPPRFE